MTWMHRAPGYHPTAAEVEMEVILGTEAESIASAMRRVWLETGAGA